MAETTPNDSGGTLLRAGEVAKRLSVPLPSLYEWVRSNPSKYGAVRVGPRAIRFRADAIAELVSGELHERA